MDRDEKVRRAKQLYQQWVADDDGGGRNQRDEEIKAARREAAKRDAEERKRLEDEQRKRGYWQDRNVIAPRCRWGELAENGDKAKQREAERAKAEKIRRAQEQYRQWVDDGHSHDRGRELTPKP